MDSSESIQYLHMEENPVGRGKNDAALIVESEPFGVSQRNLVDSIWDEAISFEAASKRFTEDRIVDPLRVTLEEARSLIGSEKSLRSTRICPKRTLRSTRMLS